MSLRQLKPDCTLPLWTNMQSNRKVREFPSGRLRVTDEPKLADLCWQQVGCITEMEYSTE